MSKFLNVLLFILALAVSSTTAAPSANLSPTAVRGYDQRLKAATTCNPVPPGCVRTPNCGFACPIDGKDWGK